MVDNFVENEHDGDVRDAAISAMALNMERYAEPVLILLFSSTPIG